MTSATLRTKSIDLSDPAVEKTCLKKVIGSCMIGNALEWYDFALYGYFAVTIGKLFFPSADPFSSLMATYGVFAAGFIMRPLGAIIFGHIGDKKGRKKALMYSIFLMAVPTACIGILPTYDQVGWLAPVMLTTIRLLQGISMGGEFTGSIVFIVEHSPPEKRGLLGSFAPFSLLIGLLVGSAVATLVSMSMSHENLDLWGWRIPFLLSLLGGAVGTYMRKSIDDPKHFEIAKKEADAHVVPIKLLMKKHKKDILRIIAFELTLSVGFYIICVFIMSYLIAFVKMDESQALMNNTISMLVFAAVIPLSGWLSDRVGRKPLMMTASALFIAFSYYLFLGLFDATQPNLQLASQIGLSMIMGLYFGPLPAFLVEFFPTKIRYSGLSISHNLSMAIFGGTAPFVVTWLIHSMNDTAAPAYYLIAASFISFICLMPLKDHFRDSLK